MSKTLFDATYQLAVLLGTVSEGIATGGSTTTIADTVARTEADDFWNNGAAWITYDAGAAGAAPQGEFGHVTDFAQTGGVITLRSALTAAVASGDRYAVSRQRYPLEVLIQKVNEALSNIGVIETTDTSTVVIAEEQTEYDLPANVIELKEVWIAGNDDSNDNRWQKVSFRDQKSATGTANKVILEHQYSAGTAVKLVYLGYHQTLRNATDKIDDSLHLQRVVANAAVGCLLWRKARVGESDSSVNELLNYYQGLAQQLNTERAHKLPPKRAKTIHFTIGRP